MSMFCERPNRMINRGMSIKEIWEEKGVFISRSLDTFISKIRKSFKMVFPSIPQPFMERDTNWKYLNVSVFFLNNSPIERPF